MSQQENFSPPPVAPQDVSQDAATCRDTPPGTAPGRPPPIPCPNCLCPILWTDVYNPQSLDPHCWNCDPPSIPALVRERLYVATAPDGGKHLVRIGRPNKENQMQELGDKSDDATSNSFATASAGDEGGKGDGGRQWNAHDPYPAWPEFFGVEAMRRRSQFSENADVR